MTIKKNHKMKIVSQKIHICSLTLLLLLQPSATLLPSQTNLNYIKNSCNSTLYKVLCVISLSPYASSIQSDPQKLAATALNLTLTTAESVAAFVKTVPKRSHRRLSQREAAAVADCVDEMGDSVYELRDSIGEWENIDRNGSSRFELVMSDVQTWVSAALTDEDTCMDGFEEGEGGAAKWFVRNMVRRRVLKVARMTSNALALINMYKSMHGN